MKNNSLNSTQILYDNILSLASSIGFLLSSVILFYISFKENFFKLEYTRNLVSHATNISWQLYISIFFFTLFLMAAYFFIKAFLKDKDSFPIILKDKWLRIFLMFFSSFTVSFIPIYIISTIQGILS